MRIFKRLLLLIIAGLVLFFLWYQVAAMTRLGTPEGYVLEVKPGENFSTVIRDLKEKSFIKSTLWFRVYGKLHSHMKIEAGYFELLGGTHYRDLVLQLQHAEQKTVKVTFLEGWSNREILDTLVSKGFKREQLEDCLKNCEFSYDFITPEVKKYQYEGYLYPDTYEFAENESPTSIFNRMLKNFDEKTTAHRSSLSADASPDMSPNTFYETIIKASLIEREVRQPEDRKIVAGIIENRLEAGMKLDMDATVLYALGDWDTILDYEKLQIDSPYNTRKFGGLPPSPICNPSLESIEAVLSPTPNDYYYYLNATDDGKTYFGKTLEEHNRNKALHIR